MSKKEFEDFKETFPGWDKLILGSVSDGVVHQVRCPVLVVR